MALLTQITDVNKTTICYKCKHWDWGLVLTDTDTLWEDICTKDLTVLVDECSGFENKILKGKIE